MTTTSTRPGRGASSDSPRSTDFRARRRSSSRRLSATERLFVLDSGEYGARLRSGPARVREAATESPSSGARGSTATRSPLRHSSAVSSGADPSPSRSSTPLARRRRRSSEGCAQPSAPTSRSAPRTDSSSARPRSIPGGAAEGLYVTNYGIANDQLPPRGREFLRGFAAANGGEPGPDLGAAYGAQAAEILLDAIARSDGTRRSVLDEVRRTAVTNGILGDIGWDAQGDLLDSPFTVFRLQDGEFVTDRVVVIRSPRDR